MDKFFDEFFEDFNRIFGRPKLYYFNCKTKDQMPSCWEKTETGFKATCRTVGVNPEDVKVSVEDDYILVTGETVMDNYSYNCKYELPVLKDVLSNVKNIKYKSANGLTFIYLEVEKPLKNNINIERI